MRFDITDLRLFLAVVETGSITHGADKVNLALGSASGRIRQMEDELGVPLLDRHRHGVTPTRAGECLMENARLVVRQTEKMRMELLPFSQGVSGTLRLLTNTAALHEHLPKRLAAFLADNPSIDIEAKEMQSADIGAALAAGRADIGIASESDLPDTFERRFFGEDQLVVVAQKGAAILRGSSVAFSKAARLNCIGLPRETALQRFIAAKAAKLGATMPIRMRVSGFDAMGQMVEAGAGIAIMPEVSARRCARSMQLAYLPLADPWAARRLAVCLAPTTRMSDMSARLMSHLSGAH